MARNDFLEPMADDSVELTTNSTAYPIPATAITYAHELAICNVSTANVYIRATNGTTVGIQLANGQSMTLKLKPGTQVYGYSGTDLQTVNYSVYKIPKPGA